MDATTPFGITVLAGAHAGAALALQTGLHAFGRGETADVVLADADLALRHFTLELSGSEAILEALADGLVVDGMPVEMREPLAVGFPIDIKIRDVRLRVDGPAAIAPAPKAVAARGTRVSARSRGTGVAVGLFALGLGLSVYAVSDGFGKTVGAAGLVHASAPIRPDQQAAGAAQFMTDRLAAAGLASTLAAEPVDGAVRITGAVRPDKQSAWEAAQRDFDATYGGRVILHVVVAAANGPRPTLAPQAVWTGPSPYILTADGERMPEGAVLGDGWTIDHILADRILLHRGAQTYALTF